MEITGVSVVNKNPTVCSDHFENHSFHQTGGYTTVRRIITNAVPSTALNNKPTINTNILKSKNDSERNIIVQTTSHAPKHKSNNQIVLEAVGINNLDSYQEISNQNTSLISISDSNEYETIDVIQKNKESSNTAGSNASISENVNSKVDYCSIIEQDPNAESNVPLRNDHSVYSSDNVDFEIEYSCRDEMDLIQKKNLCITNPKGDNFKVDYSSLEELNLKLDKSNFSLNNASNETNMSIENATAKNMQSKESRKRKHPNLRSESYTKTRKFRFTDGVQYYSMSREDFASDESWNKFIKFTIYKHRQIVAIRRQKWRQRDKSGNLKDLIIDLKKKNDVAASGYLKGLPEHVKQLMRRMKDRKFTKAYPPQLKTFARILHFHSPAAYKMVRKSFLKCLPCVETLNSWCCSKNYKPGISEEIISHVSTMVKSEKDKGKTCVFNLTFDEMNIKKGLIIVRIQMNGTGMLLWEVNFKTLILMENDKKQPKL